MKLYRTGDICPLCGQPIRLTDPGELLILSLAAELLELPPSEEAQKEEVLS